MFDDVINNLCGGPREYGVVLGSFSPMHTGHLDLVMAAKKLCSKGAIIALPSGIVTAGYMDELRSRKENKGKKE